MAPWLHFLTHKWEKNLKHVPIAEKAGQNEDGMLTVINDTKAAARFVKLSKNCPMIVSLPFKERRVMIFHSIWEHHGQFIGVAGFHMSSPLVAVETNRFTRGIIPLGTSGEKIVIRLPTLKQLVACKDGKEILEIKGDSKETAASLVESPWALTWKPETILRMGINSRQPRAIDMLWAFIKLIKEFQSQTAHGILELEEKIWQAC